MQRRVVLMLLVVVVSMASPGAVLAQPTPVLDALLPSHWRHSRPLRTHGERAAVHLTTSPWRVVPTERWLRNYPAGYARDFIDGFSKLSEDEISLSLDLPSRIAQVDLSSYKVGESYDWARLAVQHPGVVAVVEITRPVFSLDGRMAVIGYFSVEPQGLTLPYFSVMQQDSEGVWRHRVTSTGRSLLNEAP